jgi:ElaB/YqjD/DUF883 family membrane-anchored ribosome-binding protein
VTPEKTPDQIEREMQATRDSISEKVAALESQVVGTVQTAADTLTGTVESVKSLLTTAPETVTDTVKQATAAVSESVKEAFDFTSHVRRNPLAAVGVSALVGGIVGYLTGNVGRSGRLLERTSSAPVVSPSAPHATPAYAAAQPTADRKPGVFDEFMDMLGDKAKEMARVALESVSVAIKQNIETGVPKLVDDAAARLTDAGGRAQPHGDPFEARRSSV